MAIRAGKKILRIQAETPRFTPAAGGKGGGWRYLSLVKKLPDQVLFATHTSSHDGMRRDLGQVALLIFVHWLPGVVPAEQLILVPVSLVCQVLWGRKAQRS